MQISTPSYSEPARRSAKLSNFFVLASFVLMVVFMGIHITHSLDPANSTVLKHYTNAEVSRNVDYSTYVLSDQPYQSGNNYSNIGGPRPLSRTIIVQNAVDRIFWLIGVLRLARTIFLMAVPVAVFADLLSACFGGMEEWVECGRIVCLWLIDVYLWIVAVLKILVSYIPEKRLVEDGAPKANIASPIKQEPSGAAQDSLPLDEDTKYVQKDLKPDLVSVLEKLPEPATHIRSAKPPFFRTNASREPADSGTDAPKGGNVPITTIASLNWADKMGGRKKSIRNGENAEDILAMRGTASLLFKASGKRTVPTIKPTTLVSKTSSLRSTYVLNWSGKRHTGVSEERYEPSIRSSGETPTEQKCVQKEKPLPGNNIAGARVGKIQPYFA